MSERQTMMQTIKASEARQNWGQLLNTVLRGKTRVLVEKSGIPVAAIVSADDLERLTQLEEQEQAALALIERVQARNAGQDSDEVLADVTAEVESVRQERHERQPTAQRGR
jgi:prevent-host-death family protein